MKSLRRILAIETSCDDTSVALIEPHGLVRHLLSAHQDVVHRVYGGIVPELASRDHNELLLPLIDKLLEEAACAWKDVDGIVVTSRPGLLGSLLVGVVTAKTLAFTHDLPWLGVNHLEGHLVAPFLRDQDYAPPDDFDFPYLALAISGGHTQLYQVEGLGQYKVLGRTRDDAAGEAFDKFAKLIGLGYPGGVQVDRESHQGDVKRFDFPRALLKDPSLDFSFSGLKTSALNLVKDWSAEEIKAVRCDLCASYQEAIVDALLSKLSQAVGQTGLNRVVLTGGVSANTRLRERSRTWADQRGLQLVIPPLRYCTDNAAMIGWAGFQRLERGESSPYSLGPSAQSAEGDFK